MYALGAVLQSNTCKVCSETTIMMMMVMKIHFSLPQQKNSTTLLPFCTTEEEKVRFPGQAGRKHTCALVSMETDQVRCQGTACVIFVALTLNI